MALAKLYSGRMSAVLLAVLVVVTHMLCSRIFLYLSSHLVGNLSYKLIRTLKIIGGPGRVFTCSVRNFYPYIFELVIQAKMIMQKCTNFVITFSRTVRTVKV